MSDKIRNEYKNTYSGIEPRAEFLENLTQTIENEQAQQKRSKIKIIRSAASLAACFAVVVGAVVLVSNSNSAIGPDDNESKNSVHSSESSGYSESNKVDNYGETLSISSLPIKIDDWNAQDMTALECGEFMENALSGDELSYILVSDTNVFTDADKVSGQEIENLVQMFADCEETEKLSDEENRVYYMAVFEDGLIIKFNVFEDEYIEIPMKEIYLKIN